MLAYLNFIFEFKSSFSAAQNGRLCPDTKNRGVARGGAEGALAPPEFGRSVNPIQTRGGRLYPLHYCHPPGFKKLSTSLRALRAKSALLAVRAVSMMKADYISFEISEINH